MDSLKKAQRKKGSIREPEQILDRAIYHLWETINDLEQIQPEHVEFFRVSIFGSSRIQKGDPIYQDVYELSRGLSEMGIDIVTGGGPGLMEAANSGSMEGSKAGRSRSYGLPIHLPTEEGHNAFVSRVYRHRTFFSRLHHFVRLSSAFVVVPGGIGTALELFMVWQLLQVKHIQSHPLILVGPMWHGLLEWMEQTMVSRNLVSPPEMKVAVVVDNASEALPLLKETFEKFKETKNANRKRRTRGA